MALDQSQIDSFNKALQDAVDTHNRFAATDENGALLGPPESVSNPTSESIVSAMESSAMSPSDYAQMSGVSASTAQQMYDQGNPTGQYSTQTIPGTQTTWASLNQVPGMYDYVMQQSSVDDGNGDGNTVFDPSKAAQAVNSGMQNPIGIAKDYLTTQAQMVAMGSGVNSPTYFKDAVGYLANNGVSPNDIQALAQSGVNNGISTVNYMNANHNGFLGQTLDAVAGQIATPTGIASLIANSFLPGSGALVKTIADAAGGQQNLTSDLVGVAMAQYGTSVPGTSNITGALSNYVPSSVAQDMTAGALATVANLSQGKNLQDSLASGIATGVSTGLNNAVSANSPYATPNTPAPVVDLSTAPPSGLPPEGGLTQINSGNGLGDTLPMSPSSGISFDPTALPDINSISKSVTSGSTDTTAQDTTGLPLIDTTQPNLNDITQQVAPTVASGNSALTSQILPSATDIVSRVDNFNGTSTVTYKDGTTAIVDTPNSAPDYNPTTGNETGTKTTVAGALPSTGAGNTSGTTGALPDTSIPTLVAGLTKSTPLSINPYGVSFAGPVQTGDHLAKGGLVQHFEEGSAVKMPPSAGIWHGNSRVSLTPPHGALSFGPHFAEGGHFTDNEHVPEFYSEGGMHNRYVQGDGDGTSDDVPAMLANGEFVIPADVVSSLGNGSNDSGAKVLDHFLETIRLHKQAHDPKQLPPDSKGALAYLSESYKKARA